MNSLAKAIALCAAFAVGATGLSAPDDAEAGPFGARAARPAPAAKSSGIRGFFGKLWEGEPTPGPRKHPIPHIPPSHKDGTEGRQSNDQHGAPDGCTRIYEGFLNGGKTVCPQSPQSGTNTPMKPPGPRERFAPPGF